MPDNGNVLTTRLIRDGVVWDGFLDRAPYGTIFHRWRFLQIVEKHSDYRLLPYGVFRGNGPVCLFPLYYRRYRGLKLVFSPPPQTMVPYLGFVMGPGYAGLTQSQKEACLAGTVDAITAEIRRIAPNYVKMLTEPCFDDARPFLWQRYAVNVSYEYVIDLGRPLEAIRAGFDATCKKQIKHGESLGLVMRRSYDAGAFYRVMGENFREKGIHSPYRVEDSTYLKELLEAFPENVKMYFLYEEGQIAGAHVVCEYRGKCTLWLGSATGHYNEYMLWELIKLEKAAGFRVFEIQDADTPRVLPFKAKFNPGLAHKFLVNRKDALGAVAEWAFNRLVKGWI